MRKTSAVIAICAVLCGVSSASGTVTTRCDRYWSGFKCSTHDSRDDPAPPELTIRDMTVIRDREQAWEAACKPRVVTGDDGLSRYVYAHPNCDIGHLR